MEINEKIENLINENNVCLFMKGTPEAIRNVDFQWLFPMFLNI